MGRIENPEWAEMSVFHDDYASEEDMKLSPLDDDYVPDKYRNSYEDEYYD